MMKRKLLDKWFPLFTLPLILAVCLTLWLTMSSAPRTEVQGVNGIWDLRNFDFGAGSADLTGQVAFVPNALLTPGELAAREADIQTGAPQEVCRYATSRLRILLPGGATYMLAWRSADYAERVYVNGKHMWAVGKPGDSAETMVPNTADLSFLCEPENGVIEIVRQSSNFVHREGGRHDGIRVGLPDLVNAANQHDFAVLMMGCFLALFIVHLGLFFFLPSFRANLYFSLFCLIWFFRSGVVGAKVFSSLLPQLSWYAKFRIEYLSLPMTGLLVCLMLRELFPTVLPKWYRRAVHVLSAVLMLVFLFADTVSMSWAMLGCYAYLFLAIVLAAVCFAVRFRRPNPSQAITLLGLSLFLYAGIRDMFFHSGILLLPAIPATFSEVAMLVFVFFEMTAMFIGTAHAMEEARAMEQRLNAENILLDRTNRMKNDLMATVSHETRTPLAVLSGYAELIAMELRRKGVDPQTARDLDQIADETQRIAKIMEEMQTLSRNRDVAARRRRLQITDILDQTARMYAPILKRKNVTLTVEADPDLPPVFASADGLTQVMFNLLQNARNHTENGRVTVSAAREGDRVAVRVQDTGTGISPAFLPHALKRHQHENPNGAGIGLSVCEELLTELGGDIRLESELGKGTTVIFTLPIHREGGGDDAQNHPAG